MPYLSVVYPNSNFKTKQYTFYTSDTNIQKDDYVLVKDKNGFSLCKAVGYVPKPAFACSVIILAQEEMEKKVEIQAWEEEQEDGDEYA